MIRAAKQVIKKGARISFFFFFFGRDPIAVHNPDKTWRGTRSYSYLTEYVPLVTSK